MILLASITIPLILGAMVIWLVMRRQVLNCELQINAMTQQLTQCQQVIRRLQHADITISKRFAVIEKQFNHIEHRQDSLEDNQLIDSAYQQALTMANQGASIDEIVTACQLTKPEAELIINLHGVHEVA